MPREVFARFEIQKGYFLRMSHLHQNKEYKLHPGETFFNM